MANSPRMRWPVPSATSANWFDDFTNLVNGQDSSAHAAREDRNIFMGGGGTVGFVASSGLLSWSEDFDIFSPITGFRFTIPAGSVTLTEGQLLYVPLTRSPLDNAVLTPVVANSVPASDVNLVIAIRLGASVYFRTGAKLQNGESGDLFRIIGGDTPTDLYDRGGYVTIPDGSSDAVTFQLGRIAYAGSIIALAVDLTEPVDSGTIDITVLLNGVDTLTVQLNTSNPETQSVLVAVSAHPIVPDDKIEVLVEPTSYENVSGDPGRLSFNVAFSAGISLSPSEIPNASDTQKGITKLSVAPVVSTNPIAIGDNDPRVTDWTRSGSTVSLQNPNDKVVAGKLELSSAASSGNYLELQAGDNAAVSPASAARLRYNEGEGRLEVSVETGDYLPLAGGLSAVPEVWGMEDVLASLVDQPLSALVSTLFDTWQPCYAGSIRGMNVRFSTPITAGSTTVYVTINGVQATLGAGFSNVSNPSGGSADQDQGVDVFQSGDEIGFIISTSGTFAPTPTVEVTLFVTLEEP